MRDELAKVIAETKKRDSIIEQLTRALEERDRIITEMMMENDSLKRSLKIYENPHAPPSHGSVPVQQKKARSAEMKPNRPNESKERPVGRRAAGRAILECPTTADPEKAIHHRQDRCGRRKSTGIPDARTVTTKQITDIGLMPKAVTVTHVCCECVCSDCECCQPPRNQPGIKGNAPGAQPAGIPD